MRCPKCNYNKSSVIDSRQAEDGNTIRRRRECENCHARFTTFERVEELPLLVIKKDGTREQFSREKILNGIFQVHKNVQYQAMILNKWYLVSNKKFVVNMKVKFRVL